MSGILGRHQDSLARPACHPAFPSDGSISIPDDQSDHRSCQDGPDPKVWRQVDRPGPSRYGRPISFEAMGSRFSPGTLPKNLARIRYSIRKILFLIIPEPVTQLLLYERHILDFAGVPSFYVKKYLHDPDFHQSLQFSTIYYSMNVLRSPFTNRHVRKAFALSIDRHDLFRLFDGAVPVSRSFIPKGLTGFDPNSGFGFHPRKAREELKEAGYPQGKGLPLITLFFPTGTQSRILAVYMQQQFKKILGVNVQLRSLEWKVFLARLDSRTPMLYQSGWMADYPDPNTFMTLMMNGSGNNRTGWSSPEFDSLVQRAVSTSSEKDRENMYLKAQDILLRQGISVIPLAQGLTNLLVHKDVHGFWHDPLGNDHFEDVWKEKNTTGKSG